MTDEIPVCARCRRYFELLVPTVRGHLCAECYERTGRPQVARVDREVAAAREAWFDAVVKRPRRHPIDEEEEATT